MNFNILVTAVRVIWLYHGPRSSSPRPQGDGVGQLMYKQSSLNHMCHHSNFSVVRGDIRIESVMAPLIKKADIVIPLAALVGAPMCSQDPWVRPLSIMTPSSDVEAPIEASDGPDATTNSAYGTGDKNNFCTRSRHSIQFDLCEGKSGNRERS